MDMGFPAERRHFPGVHKIGAAISGPRIADTNFTDTRIFLNNVGGGGSEYRVVGKEDNNKQAAWWPWFGSVTICAWNSSSDSGFRARTVPLGKGSPSLSVKFSKRTSWFGFLLGFLKKVVPRVAVLLSVPKKTL